MPLHPLCLIRTIWRSLRCGAFVMGHDYQETGDGPANVSILECKICGHVHVGWQ